MPGATGALSIAGGRTHTCAVMPGGSLKSWGSNRDRELGDQHTAAPQSSSAQGDDARLDVARSALAAEPVLDHLREPEPIRIAHEAYGVCDNGSVAPNRDAHVFSTLESDHGGRAGLVPAGTGRMARLWRDPGTLAFTAERRDDRGYYDVTYEEIPEWVLGMDPQECELGALRDREAVRARDGFGLSCVLFCAIAQKNSDERRDLGRKWGKDVSSWLGLLAQEALRAIRIFYVVSAGRPRSGGPALW